MTRTRVKRRQRNQDNAARLAKILNQQVQHSIVLDALCNLTGLEAVKAEVQRIVKTLQEDKTNGGPNGSGTGTEGAVGGDTGTPGPSVQEDSQGVQGGRI